MAVFKLTDKPRKKPWCADIHRKGHKRFRKVFATEKEADRWARGQESSIDATGLPLTIEGLKKKTVGDIVKRYLEEKTPKKGSAATEERVLKRYAKRFGHLSLAAVTGQKPHAYGYMEGRRKDTWRDEPITERTIWREVTVLRRMYNVAKEQWDGYANLVNPFSKLKYDAPVMHRRKRRLEKGELERLEQACKGCRGLNKYFVPIAIYLAIETGMRLQEIFNLTWEDIDFDERRIEIRKSKTDYKSEYEGRTIVLTFIAMMRLASLGAWLAQTGKYKKDAPIFHPLNKNAFKQSWADVVERAKINPKGEERKRLTFHDLRREAGSIFHQAGLTGPEQDLMMGHSNNTMRGVYIDVELQSIQDKLDRYQLGGETWGERLAKVKAMDDALGVTKEEGLAIGTYTMHRISMGQDPPTNDEIPQILERIRRGKAVGQGSNVVPLRPMWKSSLA
jgi:integrase